MAKKQEKKSGEVGVKILMHVMQHQPGDVIYVDKETAKHLCHQGEHVSECKEFTRYRRAILLDEYEEEDEVLKNSGDLTMAEAAALGIKNTVDSSGHAVSHVNLVPDQEEVNPGDVE